MSTVLPFDADIAAENRRTATTKATAAINRGEQVWALQLAEPGTGGAFILDAATHDEAVTAVLQEYGKTALPEGWSIVSAMGEEFPNPLYHASKSK